MAEAFFNYKYAPKGYRAISAGTRPISQINPLAVQAMKEVGIDISNQKSKIITENMIRSSAKSVNMGCIDKAECPMLPIRLFGTIKAISDPAIPIDRSAPIPTYCPSTIFESKESEDCCSQKKQ